MRDVTTTEHLRLNLARNGPKSLAEILQDHPELAGQAHTADVVLLLLRLDLHFRLLDDGRWAIAATPQNATQRIVAVAQAYLTQFPGTGALINTVVDFVAKETGYSPEMVRSALVASFVNNGQALLNKLKGPQ